MTITKIKKQKNGRIGIYADGEFVLSLDEATFSQSSLVKGGEVSQHEFEELAAVTGDQFANDRAMTILSYRDHSKEELRRKLIRTVGEEQAEKAAQHMEDIGLVNDESYAEKLAEELLDRRLMGADRAIFEMTRHGLDRETSKEVIERLDTDPQERIGRFLAKSIPTALKTRKSAAARRRRSHATDSDGTIYGRR